MPRFSDPEVTSWPILSSHASTAFDNLTESARALSASLHPDEDGRGEADYRVLPDDSRGILVTEMIGPDSVDGPYVPASMRTDEIPLPQDFNYPSPAIDLDDQDSPILPWRGRFLTEGEGWRLGFHPASAPSPGWNPRRYLDLPDAADLVISTE